MPLPNQGYQHHTIPHSKQIQRKNTHPDEIDQRQSETEIDLAAIRLAHRV